MLEVRFTRGARKHRVGKASALHVMEHTEPERVPDEKYGNEKLVWIGDDERGRELEVVAVVRPDCLLVIHVFPTVLREAR
jgi:hypothetical protein